MKTYTEKEVIQLFIYYSDYMNDAEQHEENGDRLEFADWLKRHSANTPVIKSVCQKCGAEMEGATTKPQHDAKLPVVCSAYYVHISGMGETCIVAENIADAMDKIEKLTDANYTFIFNRSLPCIV